MRFLSQTSALCLVILVGLGSLTAQTHDISSGGLPTITGSLNGSVTGSSSSLNNLVVTVNLGELSPLNASNSIKVVVPIAIRSTQAYKVVATATSWTNSNPQSFQMRDVGFGVNNLRPMGNQSETCTRSTHTFTPAFNNDPATGVFLSAAGRASYISALDGILAGVTVINGPRLSTKKADRRTDNGYIFDAIFVVTPQFYAASTGTTTLTFSISSTAGFAC